MNDLVLLLQNTNTCYDRNKSCLDGCDDCYDKQLYGWYGAVQRQLQRSQYYMQYRRPVRIVFSVFLLIFLIGEFANDSCFIYLTFYWLFYPYTDFESTKKKKSFIVYSLLLRFFFILLDWETINRYCWVFCAIDASIQIIFLISACLHWWFFWFTYPSIF